jgi:hypothetical protein
MRRAGAPCPAPVPTGSSRSPRPKPSSPATRTFASGPTPPNPPATQTRLCGALFRAREPPSPRSNGNRLTGSGARSRSRSTAGSSSRTPLSCIPTLSSPSSSYRSTPSPTVRQPARETGLQLRDQPSQDRQALRRTELRHPNLRTDRTRPTRLPTLLPLHTAPPREWGMERPERCARPTARRRVGNDRRSGHGRRQPRRRVHPPNHPRIHRQRSARTRLPRPPAPAPDRLDPPTAWYSFQMTVDGDWEANYPDPASYIPAFFSCGGANSAGYYCHPALDREMRHAELLEPTDAPKARELWATIDRQLTNDAAWLPTVTFRDIELTSGRLRNYEYNPVWGFLADQAWLRWPTRPDRTGSRPVPEGRCSSVPRVAGCGGQRSDVSSDLSAGSIAGCSASGARGPHAIGLNRTRFATRSGARAAARANSISTPASHRRASPSRRRGRPSRSSSAAEARSNSSESSAPTQSSTGGLLAPDAQVSHLRDCRQSRGWTCVLTGAGKHRPRPTRVAAFVRTAATTMSTLEVLVWASPRGSLAVRHCGVSAPLRVGRRRCCAGRHA